MTGLRSTRLRQGDSQKGHSQKESFQRKRGIGAIALGVLACVPLVAGAMEPVPSPEEAARHAEQMSPEELVNLPLDEEMRDRLRFDPAWQPILRAVQRDLMTLKWGDNQLETPIWTRYGAKVLPLLAYYARSQDLTRQTYGILGIRALGAPYSTLWLEQQLQQPHSPADVYLISSSVEQLLDPYSGSSAPSTWKADFGLQDPQTRDRLTRVARANLPQSEADPWVYTSLNQWFLQQMADEEPSYGAEYPPGFDPDSDPALRDWLQQEQQPTPSEADIEAAIALYPSLKPASRDYLLVNHLGPVEAGKLSPLGMALLRAIAFDPAFEDHPDRVWAIAELDRHQDPQGQRALLAILNGDLSQLAPLSRWASYSNGFTADDIDRGTHAYYLLLGMVHHYPSSRFAVASKTYGDLRGRSYFGGRSRSQALRDRLARKTAADTLADWQNWLDRYPDHPGADDATYFVGRSLQDNNRILDATHVWIRLLTQPIGDNDARYLAWGHLRTLLDVGLTIPQLETLVTDYDDAAIAPLLRYALAVHYARTQNYAAALETVDGVDMTQMAPDVLGSYYDSLPWWWGDSAQPRLQQSMQTLLVEQRQRWQTLHQWQQHNTVQARYAIASHWADHGGWKNGYLPVWEQSRVFLLPTGDWGDHYCTVYWVCNAQLRSREAIHQSYWQSSQMAIALQLYQPVLMDRSAPADLREQTLFMVAATALWQWENHPLGETFQIHPLVGMTDRRPRALNARADRYEAWEADYNAIQRDYEQFVDAAVDALTNEFPNSRYIDDLLFSLYAMTGQATYLQTIVNQYPTGDRAHEAQFLIDHQHLKRDQY